MGFLMALWRSVDDRLARLSRSLQRAVRMLRILRGSLWFTVLMVLACAGLVLWRPEYIRYAFPIACLVLVLPLVALAVLVGLPLKLKRIIRLIEKGYPDNTRELAIRAAARKLRDESIETEELLWETAVNEGRKIWNKVKPQEGMAGPTGDEGDGSPAGDNKA